MSRRSVTLRQAAHLFRMAPVALERLAGSGAFPGATRQRGVWLIPLRDLKRFKIRKPGGPLPNLTIRDASSRFWCRTLRVELCSAHCVLRQQRGDEERTHDTWRGRDMRSASCRTDECDQGARIRRIVGDQPMRKRTVNYVQGRPPEQTKALRVLAAEGMLEDVPTIDTEVAS